MTIKAGEHVFLDTNVLLCASDASRDQHIHALRLLSEAGESGFHLLISGQILREYLVVATRPIGLNGLGMTSDEALRNIEQVKHRTGLIEETAQTAERLQSLVRRHTLQGKRIHDANVVATMACRGIKILITGNRRDFEGVDSIRIFDIEQAVAELPER